MSFSIEIIPLKGSWVKGLILDALFRGGALENDGHDTTYELSTGGFQQTIGRWWKLQKAGPD